MNEQTTKLIEQLAQKLGTTTEYLWGVLLKQAYVEATTTLIQTLFVVVFGVVLWRTHKKLSKKESNEIYNGYDKYEELAVTPMIFAGIIFVILTITFFICFSDVINGYFNPEYWALNKILNTIK